MSTPPAFDQSQPKIAFVPLPDTYVVWSVDAEATLNFCCDDADQVALDAVRKLTFNKYVGYCIEVRATP